MTLTGITRPSNDLVLAENKAACRNMRFLHKKILVINLFNQLEN
jgi:hypothetical protein